MIPDFKTYLKESVWGDVRRRADKKSERKEDDVNLLDLDGLCEYLNKIYGEFDHRESIKISEWKGERWLSVDLSDSPSGYILSITYDVVQETNEKRIGISYDIVKDWIDFNKLEERYNTKVEPNEFDNEILMVYPKDGSEVTNEFLIDFIDYMLPQIPSGNDKYIYKRNNESVWGDVRKRAEGNAERKEEDINSFDMEHLYQYLHSRYSFVDEFHHLARIRSVDCISTHILEVPNSFNTFGLDAYYIGDPNMMEVFIGAAFFKNSNGKQLSQKILDNFVLEKHNESDLCIKICPKEGKVDNKFFIDLIDFILDNADDTYEKLMDYKMNESVWGDIRRRAEGQSIRRENDVNNLDYNDFYDYLYNRYEKTNSYFKDKYIEKFPNSYIINIMLFENTEESRVYRVIIWNFNKAPYITIPRKQQFTKSDFFKKIQDQYTLIESGEDINPLFTVEPKDGSAVDNRFFVEVIDFMIDNIEPPFEPYLRRIDDVNESVWGDVRRRAEGQSIRKEDDIDHLSLAELFTYIKSRYEPKQPQKYTVDAFPSAADPSVWKFQIPIEMYMEKNKEVSPPITINYKGGQGFGSKTEDKILCVTISTLFCKRHPDFDKMLGSKYELDTSHKLPYFIKPKNGELTNTVVIDIIDRVLNMADDPLFTIKP